ncbi:hypothetical protein HWV62_26272 [Athelia sp. TMB]|nr:hypothetical protein HWV62_26272 [Athelia sp. TMB]
MVSSVLLMVMKYRSLSIRHTASAGADTFGSNARPASPLPHHDLPQSLVSPHETSLNTYAHDQAAITPRFNSPRTPTRTNPQAIPLFSYVTPTSCTPGTFGTPLTFPCQEQAIGSPLFTSTSQDSDMYKTPVKTPAYASIETLFTPSTPKSARLAELDATLTPTPLKRCSSPSELSPCPIKRMREATTQNSMAPFSAGSSPCASNPLYINYTGPLTFNAVRDQLRRCVNRSFKLTVHLKNDSSALLISFLANLVGPCLKTCEALRIFVLDSALLSLFFDRIRRSMALSLKIVEIHTGPGVVLADGQIPRMTFLKKLPLERLELDGVSLSALEASPDAISLCVNQRLDKRACSKFFLKIAGSLQLCELEMRGWSRYQIPETSKTGETMLRQLLYLRIVGINEPLRTQEATQRNPLRALLQQFQAPRLHLCEIVCRTRLEGHQALSLFSRRDNLLMSSSTLEELTLHFCYPRDTTTNTPMLTYGKLIEVLPPVREMRLGVAPRKDQYSLQLVFEEEDPGKQRSLRRALRQLDLHFSDEDSLMDFIRACVPSHRPRKRCVYSETGECWKRLRPSFVPGLHSLKLNPKFRNEG